MQVRSGPEWDELGRIDYFLDQLARAVERGEVPLDSYESLAPCYLERRAELVAVLDRRAGRLETASPKAHPAGTESRGTAPVAGLAQTVPVRRTPKEPVQVPWTTVLTFVGAFLVVVAAAIFAVATWDIFDVGFKLTFMGALTVAFYFAAEIVDRRFSLRAGAYALATVAGAMLLFDGWIVIDGYGLSGLWPWAVLLLVCSLVYWAMEFRLTGGFFGVVGASAQVGWWWLMTAALGWPLLWRIAGMSVVAVLWTLSSTVIRDVRGARVLAGVLRWGAFGIVALGSIISLGDIATIGRPTSTELAATAAVALAALAVLWDREDMPFQVAAVGSLPFVAALASAAVERPSWVLLGFALAASLVFLVVEILKQTWVFAALAVGAEVGFWLILLDLVDASPSISLGVIAAVGASWIAATALMSDLGISESSWLAGTRTLAQVIESAGWLALAVCTLMIPVVVDETLPLAGELTTFEHAWIALWLTVLWAAATLVRKQPLGAPVVVFGSLYSAAAILGPVFPDWPSALYAAALMAPVFFWSQFGGWIGPHYGLREEDLKTSAHALAFIVPLVGLLAALGYESIDEWATPILLGTAVVYWAADVLRHKTPLSWAPLGASIVGAAAAAVFVPMDSEEAVVAAGASALVLVAMAPLASSGGARATASSRSLAIGAASAATIAAPLQLGAQNAWWVAGAFGLMCLVWAVATWAADIGAFALFAGLFGIGASLSVLEAVDSGPWATVLVCGAIAFACLAPAWRARANRPSARSQSERATWSSAAHVLVVVGAVAIVIPVLMGFLSAGDATGASRWLAVVGHPFAVAIALAGGWVVAVSALFESELGEYLGEGIIVMALLHELGIRGVEQVQVYTTLIALYLVAIGYLYSRRVTPHRRVPVGLDLAVVAIGLGIPALQVLAGGSTQQLLANAFWAVGIALVAITAGVPLKVRSYFFGGVALIVWVSFWRSLSFLVAYWWLALGMIGVAMLVIALTWERQRMVLMQTQERVRSSFEGWR